MKDETIKDAFMIALEQSFAFRTNQIMITINPAEIVVTPKEGTTFFWHELAGIAEHFRLHAYYSIRDNKVALCFF